MEHIVFIGMGIIVVIMVSYLVGFWCGGNYMLKRMQRVFPHSIQHPDTLKHNKQIARNRERKN